MEQTQQNRGGEKKSFFTARNITWFAILLALVIVLQCFAGSIVIGTTSFSLVLIPIVLGGILLGPIAGGVLGFAFGLITLIYGVVGMDPLFTTPLFYASPFMTVLICLGKGTAAGVGAAWIYRLIARKNRHAAVFAAAAAAPILNTGLFILGALCISDVIAELFAGGASVLYFLVIGCAGVNFLVEFAVNMILSPALWAVIRALERRSE